MIAFGIDLGRKHDSTAIVSVERDDEGIVRVLAIHEMKNVPFAEQVDHIRRMSERYQPSSVHVDSTGLGLPVVEELQRKLGAVVAPVSFSAQSKAELVSRTVVLLQDRKLRLPRHDRLKDELHSVTRAVTKDGTILYRVSQKFGFSGAEYHHADLAWALMLAVAGLPQGAEIGYVLGPREEGFIEAAGGLTNFLRGERRDAPESLIWADDEPDSPFPMTTSTGWVLVDASRVCCGLDQEKIDWRSPEFEAANPGVADEIRKILRERGLEASDDG